MSAAPKLELAPPQGAQPAPSSDRNEHLELVPPPPPAPIDNETRRLRDTRWLAALLAVVTAAVFGLWTAAMLGATDSAGGPPRLESCSPESSRSGSSSCARRAEDEAACRAARSGGTRLHFDSSSEATLRPDPENSPDRAHDPLGSRHAIDPSLLASRCGIDGAPRCARGDRGRIRSSCSQSGTEAQSDVGYRALNPLGAVPTLVDGDLVVTESAAIVLYLADRYPEARLAPQERAPTSTGGSSS